MAKYLFRLRPIGILLFIVLISQVPNIVAWIKPNTYWVDLWGRNANRDIAPFVVGLFAVLPIVWLVYRLKQARTLPEKLSERTEVIFFIIDFVHIIVCIF